MKEVLSLAKAFHGAYLHNIFPSRRAQESTCNLICSQDIYVYAVGFIYVLQLVIMPIQLQFVRQAAMLTLSNLVEVGDLLIDRPNITHTSRVSEERDFAICYRKGSSYPDHIYCFMWRRRRSKLL